jgi:activating signal cointegrator 1
VKYKVLSLNPPYGSLIAVCESHPDLGKHIETRGRWHYTYTGPLLIHQTVGLGAMFADEAELAEFCAQEPFRSALAAIGITRAAQLPRGAIVARTTLMGCEMIGVLPDGTPTYMRYDEPVPYLQAVQEPERSFGYYARGRYALPLVGIHRVDPPILARGFQGLWEWEGTL